MIIVEENKVALASASMSAEAAYYERTLKK